MSSVSIVLRKELRELLAAKGTLLTGIALALFFGVMYSLKLGSIGSLSLEQSLGSLLFFLTTTLGVFMGYTFTSQVFLREKMDGVIETLLCSPVTLRGIWLGKTLAVTLVAVVLAIGSGVLTAVVAGYRAGSLALPEAAVVFHVVVVLPMIVACLVGGLGFAQLLLGMKENRIIGLALFIPIFAALYGIGYSSTGSFVAGWLHVGLLGLGAVAVLASLGYASLRLNKERIVTTLS